MAGDRSGQCLPFQVVLCLSSVTAVPSWHHGHLSSWLVRVFPGLALKRTLLTLVLQNALVLGYLVTAALGLTHGLCSFAILSFMVCYRICRQRWQMSWAYPCHVREVQVVQGLQRQVAFQKLTNLSESFLISLATKTGVAYMLGAFHFHLQLKVLILEVEHSERRTSREHHYFWTSLWRSTVLR